MANPTNIWYSNVGAVQAGGVNVLANLADTVLTAGRVKQITATYTMTGNEVANDVIYIQRVPQGSLPEPAGTMCGNGIATTATVSVGDLDTAGGTVAPDLSRYSAAQNVAAAVTTGTGVAYSGGTALTAPTEIVDDWVWLVAQFATLAVPVAGKIIVFRQKVSMID